MAAVVSVAIILVVIWVHLRRKRSKSGQLEVSGQPQPPQTQISVIMDNDKMTGNTVFFFSVLSTLFFLQLWQLLTVVTSIKNQKFKLLSNQLSRSLYSAEIVENICCI